MLLARTLPALVLPRLALSISTQSITATALVRARGGPITVSASALNRASNTTATPLGNLPAPPLGIYSSLVSYQSIRNMGSDSSKVSSSAPKAKSDEEWRTILTPAQFKVLRKGGTEPGFSSPLDKSFKEGVYNCAACDTPLYTSGTKFKSGCGWPAFFDAIPGAVSRKVDWSFGMKRTEIRCTACDSHLGHVFEGEGFGNPTDERHCVNGICLRFNDQDSGKM